ncbi:helix-turn-helix and ligand-binding sensor domain-containing protein [Flavobacteriaceae bacterium 14752]|uniref:helix-turn-helix and ligand-binding sensor domain-containing protein n=1 Tax=Mesohalobacter salilacus TaxID=2491711 RepID=UPI000F63AAA0|nr:Y Y Y domain-containing protein [Flavobacteriaceae bacterium 14752]
MSFFLLLSLFHANQLFAQEIPPVLSFSPEIYGADNQNWSITQTDDNNMFFANGKGLLMYDGERWQLLGSPNNTILRSVFAVGNDIYTGAYMDFGIWQKKDNATYQYKSLSKELNLAEDEQFWKITTLNDYVLFQSLNSIYMYDTINKDFEVISADNGITKLVVLDNIMYYHKKHEGIFKQINGKEIQVNTSNAIKNSILINLYKINDQIYAQTQYNGIINIKDNTIYTASNDNGLLSKISVYNSLQVDNGDIYLGTISHGLIKLSQNKISFQLNQDNALLNNTVLSLFQDNDKNIWLGLDNGINTVNVNSELSIFNDDNGKLGTIYTSIIFNGDIYLGTNQGLFKLNQESKEFELINNTKGQVWSLFEHKNTLFCGHHNGTYIINDDNAKLLNGVQGTWMFKAIDENTIISGNYEGLNIYTRNEGLWQHDKKLKGFEISTKYFEFIDSNNILVNHEYKGIYKLTLDEDLTQVVNFKKDESIEKGLFSSIIKFQDKILYAYKKGIYFYDKNLSEFKKDTVLSKIYTPENYSSGRLIKTKDNKLWVFTKTDIVNITPSSVKNEYTINRIPINVEARHQISGYENVNLLKSGNYLIGKSDGYLKVNPKQFINLKPEVSIKKINVENKANQTIIVSGSEQIPVFKNKFNNISFYVSSNNFDLLLKSEYQYKLQGYNDTWSEWQDSGNIVYKNLSFGDYTFKVRSRIGKDNLSKIQSFKFKVKRPFYLSNLMIVIYVVLFVLIALSIHSIYKQYYKKQKRHLEEEAERKLELKELESQKKIMKLNNEKLKHDVESKNRELAISTMGLIKKNEFLSKIKSDLNPVSSSHSKIKKVIKTIDNNLNDTDDWKFFEEAFNNADKDFFKKLKDKHSSLTPNDLKLCAYLRLNLTSKEIAPLFNISTKSVEIKRYRLRKKMNLNRDESLTNYILGL